MNEDKALSRVAALCAKAEYCKGDIDDKLRRWGLDGEARQRVIDYLVGHHYIDDARYCRAFVNDKINYNHWGRLKIEQALWQKHVAEAVSAPVLDAVPDEDYLAVLRPLLKAKWPTITAASDYERSMKLIRFAMGRGFSLDLIKKALPTDDDHPV
ncbi:MAG: regulatory protein RecX [Prevotella sp.]|nr:regulatory protein RecX [Prevotella sp.]